MLVQIDERMINTDEMVDVTRCGNYTHIRLRGPRGPSTFLEVWDETRTIWNRIIDAVRSDGIKSAE
jgi:hypothetical protein